jgi:2-phospho-L-lactate guanylyltransferase
VAETIVVGADAAVEERTHRDGVLYLEEGDGSGLNRALDMGRLLARKRGAEALLILPADLPFLFAGELTSALADPPPPFLVIAGDRNREGTNLLFFSPIEGFPFRFGQDSLHAHAAAAETTGRKLFVRDSPGLSFDLDTPEDYAAVRERIDNNLFGKGS